MKIQPLDCQSPEEPIRIEPVKPVVKSRLKRLFERQFPSVLRISAPAEKVGVEEPHLNKDGSGEFEPSSVCLAKMVQNFIEESNEKQSAAVRCGRSRCNCFNVNNDSSEDELDSYSGFGDSNLASSAEAYDVLKSLVLCASVCERNLLADTAKIVEKNKICKRKDDFCMQIVTDGLSALGYDASICKSRWEKSPSFPAGEYEYTDVIVEGERLLIDIDFRSEFEIARSTKTYKSILQSLPQLFVGKADRLQRIISIVSEAAKQSLKRKGMHFPPWRKAEYVRAKWLSPYTRTTPTSTPTPTPTLTSTDATHQTLIPPTELGRSLGEESSVDETGFEPGESMFALSGSSSEEEKTTVVKQWKPPEIKPKMSSQTGVKIVTGLASVMKDKP
ncbi:hypothetical protein L1049_004961 [Liquidambar formosana]|uniref:Uncharacterized protein n=1 Tax=Liquidambar formosana TaxID=63359 RepID=A0AAP0RU30_LIQFO